MGEDGQPRFPVLAREEYLHAVSRLSHAGLDLWKGRETGLLYLYLRNIRPKEPWLATRAFHLPPHWRNHHLHSSSDNRQQYGLPASTSGQSLETLQDSCFQKRDCPSHLSQILAIVHCILQGNLAKCKILQNTILHYKNFISLIYNIVSVFFGAYRCHWYAVSPLIWYNLLRDKV